jgi:hydroxymethylbilane synthase
VGGLARLGRDDGVAVAFDPSLSPPAPGLGALAIQVRADDVGTRATLARLDDPAVREAVEAERLVLALLGGGCQAPIGAFASVDGERLRVVAGRVEPDGRERRIGAWDGRVGSGSTLAARVAEALA